MKRFFGAVISIFVVWNVIDYIVHGVILKQAYQETAQLWRPMEEMKMVLMYFTVLISTIVFVTIYKRLITNKSMNSGIQYGVLFGIGAGISMGYGSYSVMPIPYILAITWFLGVLIEAIVAGILVGMIIKE